METLNRFKKLPASGFIRALKESGSRTKSRYLHCRRDIDFLRVPLRTTRRFEIMLFLANFQEIKFFSASPRLRGATGLLRVFSVAPCLRGGFWFLVVALLRCGLSGGF